MKNSDLEKVYDSNFIYHFGIWIDKRKTRIYLDRDNYCVIDKKSYTKVPAHTEILENWDKWKEQKKTLKFEGLYAIVPPPGLKFDKIDNELVLSEEYCIMHKKECLKNYDLSMEFYKKLDINKYNKIVEKIIKKHKKIDIKDLNDCKGKKGIYILLQENYKQMYIGQTTRDLKERILRHWKKKPAFDRILFGKAESSVIGVDSFGALDTTRIFVYYEDNKNKIDKLEEKLVEEIPNEFLNNRIGGGIHLDSMLDVMNAVSTINKRNL